MDWQWALLISALLVTSVASAAPAGRLGIIVDDEIAPEQQAIADWAAEGYSVTLIKPDREGRFLDGSGNAIPLGEFSCLWYHCVMGDPREMAPWYCPLTTEASTRAMVDYLACGGGLYVTGSGARYLLRLGIEPYYPSMNYVKVGTGTACGYEVMAHGHPIFEGLPDPFMVQHMGLEENGATGFWTPEKLFSPLAYSYHCSEEQQKRFLAGTPLARWANLEQDRYIIVEHQAGAGKVITNGPYFYYFDDADDEYRDTLAKLTDNILGYLWHEGPVDVQPDTPAAQTIMRRTGVHWGLGLSDDDFAAIDVMDYFFDPSLLVGTRGYGTTPWRPSLRMEKTIGVNAERGKGYIAGDIRYNPIVSIYGYPQCESLFPNNSNAEVLQAWGRDYLLTGDAEGLAGLRNCVDFVLYAQYDEHGYNAFLDDTGQMQFENRRGNPDWAYGWPYMNFDWPDGFGYDWKAFESFHHTTPAYPLVKAYEITGDERCLEAARLWLEHQLPRYGPNGGVYEVEWNGHKAYWTGYNPMPPAGSDMDAVDNIQTLLAEPLAAAGYHTKDPWMLERARGLLWYVCRELAADGEWYYMSIDSTRYGLMHRSHQISVAEPGMNAIAYLEAAGIDCTEIKYWFLRGVLLQRSWAAPSKWGFPHCLVKLLPAEPLPHDASANGREIEFLDYFKAHHCDLKRVVLRDTIPEGFVVPDQLALTIDGPGGRVEKSVTPDELAAGILLNDDCKPGQAFAVRHTLQVEDVTKLISPTTPQVVLGGLETMRGPEAWVEKTSDAVHVGDYFQASPLNAETYTSRGLYGGPLPDLAQTR